MNKFDKRQVLHGFTAGIIDPSTFTKEQANDYGNPAKFFDAIASDQADLNFVSCVLTEEGTNNNGADFTRELLIARHASARLKPFNIEHNKTEIIGTIYDSALADENNNIIDPESLKVNEDGSISYDGEGKIRVLVAAVLYNMIGRDEVPRIVQEVKSGSRVDVSMECWFTDWNYVLIDKSGNTETVKASENSKYLLDYVGKEWNGRKVIQRFSKENFIFGGIGQVSKGACPASVFLAAANLREADEIEGPSAFDKLNFKSVESLYSILTDEQKEQLNELVSASNNTEGANEMKVKRLDKDGNPVLDSQGKEIFDEVSKNENPNSLVASIQEQAITIADQRNTINDLQNKLEEEEKKVSNLNEQVETAAASEKERADKLEADLEKVSSEAKSYMYMNKFMKEHSNLKIENESETLKMFASKDFDDNAFKNFIANLENEVKEKEEASAKLQRQTLCELFGLNPESATDKDIEDAKASLKSKITVEGEQPDTPVKSEDNTAQANQVKNSAQASSSKIDLNKFSGSGFTIHTHDTETGKKEEITIS